MTIQQQLILNVDDTDAARYAKTRILTKAGMRVVEAASGTEALALARELRPDLILLDVKLPDIHGMEVCARLKADPATSFILVLQTSASYIGVADKIRALEGGADNYLFEPIEPAELVANVNALLRLAKVESELREMDRRKDEFLAILAHELRNPLVPIRNAIGILNTRAPDAPDWELRARSTISRHLDHMVRLVDDLLDVSRLSHNKLALQSKRTSVGDIVQSALEATRQLMERKRQRLETVCADPNLAVMGDEVRLTQVLINLLHNAAKFTADGGLIELAAYSENGRVVITVSDNGIGISPERLEEIWGMFAQANVLGHDRQDGLGIGLSLAKSLIELHDGSLTAHSEGLDKGSCFRVELPQAASSANDGAQDAPPAPGQAPVNQGPLRILVVDDNIDIADTMKELMELLGHEADVAYSGADAIRRATEIRPDAVMLDIGLKDMTGYELIRSLRGNERTRDIYLLACSGFSGDEDKQQAFNAGVDDYLVKPVDIDTLAQLTLRRGARPY
ncbi:response regulator [Herbaspirillum sp. LeCh32-8]|uniref:ATP-binding response regulator n=1 Tax=Herbaspirillum sp. LeCh32-8 TaxID=2821356 RepID=UPI001AE23B7B|nr:response regulator [Herbaspirillum sp. LeCh32-8]MBP0599832.1 response regulator [Herbaspirillum sp. LeCh32-8]